MKQCAKGERAWGEEPLREEGGREGERDLSPLDMLGKFATGQACRERAGRDGERKHHYSISTPTHTHYTHTLHILYS